MTGNDVRRILQENQVNLSWLSEQLGISPQGLNSRLNARSFKTGYLMEINQLLGRNIFETALASNNDAALTSGTRQPILDIRVCAGNGIGLEEGDEDTVQEYVEVPTFMGCMGVTVYGESMYPTYKPGDVVFVRRIMEARDIDYGQAYLVVTPSDRLLKSIYQSKKGDEFLRLTSINMATNDAGDRLFPDRDIRATDVVFLYKVVGSISRSQI